jgi:hypothetical protein
MKIIPRVRSRVKVFKAEELKSNPMKLNEGSWTHALVEVDNGIFICEIYANGMFCHAGQDVVDRQDYEGFIAKEKELLGEDDKDKTYKTWEEYRSWVLADICKPQATEERFDDSGEFVGEFMTEDKDGKK